MDSTAIALCRDNKLPVIVFDLHRSGNIGRLIRGDLSIGTRVE
jgi:uridylate kinase